MVRLNITSLELLELHCVIFMSFKSFHLGIIYDIKNVFVVVLVNITC